MHPLEMDVLILAGGEGKRLWPLSNEDTPKALVSLNGQRSLFEGTSLRIKKLPRKGSILISCRRQDLLEIKKIVRKLHLQKVKYLIEDEGKNTAPSIFAASILLEKQDHPLLVLPIDHVIPREDLWLNDIIQAYPKALGPQIVTFGVKPEFPSSDHGYIICKSQDKTVKQFVEKPAYDIAKQLLEEDAFWNMGMLFAKPSSLLHEGRKFCPELVSTVSQSILPHSPTSSSRQFHHNEWKQLPSISFDYAVLEKTDRCVVHPMHHTWKDIGTWAEVQKMWARDQDGNAKSGHALLMNCKNCTVISKSKPLVVSDMENCLVVETEHGILVANSKEKIDSSTLQDFLKST